MKAEKPETSNNNNYKSKFERFIIRKPIIDIETLQSNKNLTLNTSNSNYVLEKREKENYDRDIEEKKQILYESQQKLRQVENEINLRLNDLLKLSKQSNDLMEGKVKAESELLQKKLNLDRLSQDLDEKNTELSKLEQFLLLKEQQNGRIAHELEQRISILEDQKVSLNENIIKYNELELQLREREDILKSQETSMNKKMIELDKKEKELSQLQKEMVEKNQFIDKNIERIEYQQRNIEETKKTLDIREEQNLSKEKELMKLLSDLKEFSEKIQIEKEHGEKKLLMEKNKLAQKEHELFLKERILTEQSSKEEDLELKMLGLQMNEQTFKRKLDLELKNYQAELSRLQEREEKISKKERLIGQKAEEYMFKKDFKKGKMNNNLNLSRSYANGSTATAEESGL